MAPSIYITQFVVENFPSPAHLWVRSSRILVTPAENFHHQGSSNHKRLAISEAPATTAAFFIPVKMPCMPAALEAKQGTSLVQAFLKVGSRDVDIRKYDDFEPGLMFPALVDFHWQSLRYTLIRLFDFSCWSKFRSERESINTCICGNRW